MIQLLAATDDAAINIALVRAILVGLAAAAVAVPIRRTIENTHGFWLRRMIWAVVLAPLLAPSILIGFAWANTALRLSQWDVGAVGPAVPSDWLVGLILLFKFTPLAILILWFAPASATSRSACYCERLLDAHPARPRTTWVKLRRNCYHAARYLAGPGRAAVYAFFVVFLLTHQEFELTSLLFATSWTVTLFDAQVGGAALSETAGKLPIARMVLLFSGLWIFAVTDMRTATAGERDRRPRMASPAARMAAWTVIVAGCTTTLVWPVYTVLHEAVRSGVAASQVGAIASDIAVGVVFALGAAFVTLLLVKPLEQPRLGHGIFVGVLCIPALFGSLTIALALLALVQLPGLNLFAGQAPPLLLGLVLYLMPLGALLMLLYSARRNSAADFLTGLINRSPDASQRRSARDLRWTMRHQPLLALVMLLFWWGFFDLTLSSILLPVSAGYTPVSVRLYNFLHYGRSDALAAMVGAVMLVPVCLWGVGMVVGRIFVRRGLHG